MTFASLHNHTQASMLDASAKPKELAAKAKELGLSALAITDHGNLYNAVPFYLACRKEDIKPILGVEFNFVEDCTEATAVKNRRVQHIVLLAENYTGWQNIVKLVTVSNSPENFWFKPRIDFRLLEEHNEGVIALTACTGGLVASYLRDRLDDDGELMARKSVFRAESIVRKLLTIYDNDHLFLEVQDNGQSLQTEVNSELRRLALKFGLSTVATLNVHYVDESDSEAHAALQAMQGDFVTTSLSDFRHQSGFHLRGPNDLSDMDFTPEEIAATATIANRCNVELDFASHKLPSYPHVPEGQTTRQYFRSLIKKGAIARGLDQKSNADEYRQRLSREMRDIEDMGFEDYFLIVWDVVSWVTQQNILVGPGRGSAGGSLVSYVLGITNIDPLPYGLIWERFLNKGRKSLPDIDTDVPQSKRGVVLEYIRQRFGEEKVAQLATFNQLAARAVLKDVFRVYDVPFSDANAITACVPLKGPDHGKVTLDYAIENVPALKEYEKRYKPHFAVARKLEGCYKSLGTHAAAVVISDHPFADGHYPLCRSADNKSLVFSWDMDAVDRLGLLKLDILGLSTLDVIQHTFDMVAQRHGVQLAFDNIPLDDAVTFELLSSGRTVGVFQLEKQLGKTWSKQLSPQSVEEISDTVSIIRPGPLESGMHNTYRAVKRGEHVPNYIYGALKPILDPTYGALLYQEQVIYICQQLANMNLVDADMVRKAMGKKKPEEMAKWEEVFIGGCAENGVPKEVAQEIWGWIQKFAGYGFNKSHGVGYALLAYYTAYLKANYPVEFFAACLRSANHAQDTAEEVNKFVNDAKLFGISVTPPNVSVGNTDFDVVDEDHIAFGLATLKGVGEKAIGPIKRAYQAGNSSFEEFIKACIIHKVNRRVVEALILSGSTDCFGGSRVQQMATYELYMGLTPKEREALEHVPCPDLEAGVDNLSSEACLEANKDILSAAKLRPPNARRRESMRELLREFKTADLYDGDAQRVGWEQHYLGISLTADETSAFRSRNTVSDVVNFGDDQMSIEIAAKVDAVKVIRTKTGANPGQEMAFLTLSDHTGQADNFVVFPQQFAKANSFLKEGNIVKVRGIVDDRSSVIVRTVDILK